MKFKASMKKQQLISLLPAVCLFFSFTTIGSERKVKDYLNVPGPIKFDDIDYDLVWSSHPTINYYKQEYISKGDNIDVFNRMLFIDVILSDSLDLKNVVANKVYELNGRKKTDSVVNYKIIHNPESTQYIVDFVVSQSAEGSLHIVEWSAYRYQLFADKAGHKGVMLLGVSRRAYDNDIRGFFESLKDIRKKYVNKLIDYPIPVISIKSN